MIAGVGQVQYSQDWVESLSSMVRYIEAAAMIVGVILSAACVTIIANTIRLTLYARREEIEILGMIGATKAFIRIPYVLEGAVLGFLGSALSLIILKIGFELFRYEIRSTSRFLGVDALLIFFPLEMCVLLAAWTLSWVCRQLFLTAAVRGGAGMRAAVRIGILCLSITGVLTEAARPESDRRDSYGDKIEQERKNLEKLRGSIEEKKKEIR